MITLELRTRNPDYKNMHNKIHISQMKSVGFISDLHLSSSDTEIEDRLKHALEHWALNLDYLFILGDLFEYWIGDDASEQCGLLQYEQLLAQFSSDTKTELLIMHGNRDFLLGTDFCQRIGASLIPDPTVLHYGDIPILLAHGDALCTDDYEHMLTRSQLRSKEWQNKVLSKSIEQRLAIAHSAREQSEESKRRKSMEIMDVNQNAVIDSMQEHRCRLMIHGHTHRPAIHNLEIERNAAIRIVLSDWFDEPGIVELADNRLTVLSSEKKKISINPSEFKAPG